MFKGLLFIDFEMVIVDVKDWMGFKFFWVIKVLVVCLMIFVVNGIDLFCNFKVVL